METLAPETTAPLLSVTVPCMLAPNWAKAAEDIKKIAVEISRVRTRVDGDINLPPRRKVAGFRE
jgi:hypothetical protein